MQFNLINQNKKLETPSFSDSFNNLNININSYKKIDINELTKGEGIASEIIKESNNTNQIYNGYDIWEEDSMNSFNSLEVSPSFSEELEEVYDNNEEEQINTEFDQTQIEILIEGDEGDEEEKKVKRGRPLKSSLTQGKHTRKSNDNGSKVIINSCLKSIHKSLEESIKTFIGKKRKKEKKINGKLHHPTINNYLIKGHEEKRSLFKSLLKTLYYETKPKRVPDKIKNEKEKYCYNKEVLDNILTLEEKSQTKLKELNMKFDAELKLYLEAFLNDKNYIIVNGEKLDLLKFETLKDCFNVGKNSYSPEEKEEIKQYIYDIIDNKIKSRKKVKAK